MIVALTLVYMAGIGRLYLLPPIMPLVVVLAAASIALRPVRWGRPFPMVTSPVGPSRG